MYAKLNNKVLQYAPLNYKLEDGRIITNFNKNEVLMEQYGFKNVIDNRPVYDNNTQYLSIEKYIETDNDVTINYTINDILVTPSIEQRLASVEEVILNLL